MNQSRAAAAPVESVARDAHGKLGGAEGRDAEKKRLLYYWVVIVGGDTSYMLVERELAIAKVVSPAAIRRAAGVALLLLALLPSHETNLC